MQKQKSEQGMKEVSICLRLAAMTRESNKKWKWK